jgi:hypothetical protein
MYQTMGIGGLRRREKYKIDGSTSALIKYSLPVCILMFAVGALAWFILYWESLPWHDYVSGDGLKIYFLCHIMLFMIAGFSGFWAFTKSGLQSMRVAFLMNVIWAAF